MLVPFQIVCELLSDLVRSNNQDIPYPFPLDHAALNRSTLPEPPARQGDEVDRPTERHHQTGNAFLGEVDKRGKHDAREDYGLDHREGFFESGAGASRLVEALALAAGSAQERIAEQKAQMLVGQRKLRHEAESVVDRAREPIETESNKVHRKTGGDHKANVREDVGRLGPTTDL